MKNEWLIRVTTKSDWLASRLGPVSTLSDALPEFDSRRARRLPDVADYLRAMDRAGMEILGPPKPKATPYTFAFDLGAGGVVVSELFHPEDAAKVSYVA